jgi:hypothetical protein
MILPSVLYACETCSLALREEHRPKKIGSRVLKRIFGLKRGKIMRLGKLLNQELHTFAHHQILHLSTRII